MLNFAVGPVEMYQSTLDVASKKIPYFRTEEFSEIVLECENTLLEFLNAPKKSRVAFLTGSGTLAMETSVSNIFTDKDKLLIVVGGGFGARFSKICDIHNIPHDNINLQPGAQLTKEDLAPFENKGYTGFLFNLGETSTGVLFDLKLISEFCTRNKLMLIVDAISAFMADEIDMSKYKVDAVLIGSQKALALAPGLSACILSQNSLERIEKNPVKSLYMDLKAALKDGERGQTPFTPAVGTIFELHDRLLKIKKQGFEKACGEIAFIAKDFRSKIADLPLVPFTSSPSNAVTSLKTINCSAYKIFEVLKDEYDIFICPNGGELKNDVFRVGHLGNLTTKDNDKLVSALHDLQKRKILI